MYIYIHFFLSFCLHISHWLLHVLVLICTCIFPSYVVLLTAFAAAACGCKSFNVASNMPQCYAICIYNKCSNCTLVRVLVTVLLAISIWCRFFSRSHRCRCCRRRHRHRLSCVCAQRHRASIAWKFPSSKETTFTFHIASIVALILFLSFTFWPKLLVFCFVIWLCYRCAS